MSELKDPALGELHRLIQDSTCSINSRLKAVYDLEYQAEKFPKLRQKSQEFLVGIFTKDKELFSYLANDNFKW